MPPSLSSGEELTFAQFLWLWNRTQRQGTPALHREIAQWLDERWRAGDHRLLLLVFRDAGKSTVVGLFCAWLLAREPNLRILVLSAEQSLAGKMVRNVRRIVERHPTARDLVPKRADQWAADRFTVTRPLELRDPSLLARGIGANITGSRADVVICDDVEVPNTCDTPTKRAELRARLAEIGFVLVPNGLQLYIGTPHHYYSIYADEPRPEAGESAPFLDQFTRLTIPLLDEQGQSRWPERFTAEKVAQLRREVGPARFASQMMLRPTRLQEMRLDPAHLRRYDAPIELREANGEQVLTIAGHRMVSATCFWDPAYGAPGRGDASVVAAVFVDDRGSYWLHGLRYLVFDPARTAETDEATQLCRQVAAFARMLALPSVAIETNGIGRFLPALLRRELAAEGQAVRVIEHVSTGNKAQRILDAFDPLLAAGALNVHADVWRTPFVAEMGEWEPGRGCRDDGLDAVALCLLADPARIPRRASGTQLGWRPGRPTTRAFTDFRI